MVKLSRKPFLAPCGVVFVFLCGFLRLHIFTVIHIAYTSPCSILISLCYIHLPYVPLKFPSCCCTIYFCLISFHIFTSCPPCLYHMLSCIYTSRLWSCTLVYSLLSIFSHLNLSSNLVNLQDKLALLELLRQTEAHLNT